MEKQPTGHGPEGRVESRPAAALLVGYVPIQICALLAPCRRPILNPTKLKGFRRRYTSPRARPLRTSLNWILRLIFDRRKNLVVLPIVDFFVEQRPISRRARLRELQQCAGNRTCWRRYSSFLAG